VSKKDLLANLWDIGEKVVKSKGFELVDVEFVKEMGNHYLRYYIDKPGGITLDDCQLVSMEIEKILDETDPIPHSYILEVSSPGIERPLKHDKDFLRFIGSLVEIKTFEKIEGKKVFTGTLEDYSDGVVTINDGQSYSIPREKISSAKLKYKWDGEQR